MYLSYDIRKVIAIAGSVQALIALIIPRLRSGISMQFRRNFVDR
jgi:hypothetical protein